MKAVHSLLLGLLEPAKVAMGREYICRISRKIQVLTACNCTCP
jgi:hypothetical protein